jgi:hypothetical protein
MTVISSTGTFNGDVTDGLQFGADGIELTVATYALIYNSAGAGVSSTRTDSTVINNGIVYGGAGFNGMSLTGDNAVITNNAGARIRGYNAITLNGDGATITNHGEVFGNGGAGGGIALATNATNVVLNNDGDIHSTSRAIVGSSTAGSAVVNNAGLISGDTYGILLFSGQTMTITNTGTGTIEGTVEAIRTNVGNAELSLNNKGVIDGIIDCTASANDTIVNKGKLIGATHLGPGDDTFVFAGGKQGKVFGEDGADHFNFKTNLVTGTHAAKIGDFTHGEDLIGLSKGLFDGIAANSGSLKGKYFHVGTSAHDANDRIIYDDTTGKLYYDRDGTGSAHQKLFARLDGKPELDHHDLLVLA